MAGVGGAAVPGRLSLAGTEARPTELFSYQVAFKKQLSNCRGAPRCAPWLRADTQVRPYIKYPVECDLVSKRSRPAALPEKRKVVQVYVQDDRHGFIAWRAAACGLELNPAISCGLERRQQTHPASRRRGQWRRRSRP